MDISANYNFNNQGNHRGWFLGGGFSQLDSEVDYNYSSQNSASFTYEDASASVTIGLFRGGYAYIWDNNLFIEFSLNIPLSNQELESKVVDSSSDEIDLTTEISYSFSSLSLYYAF